MQVIAPKACRKILCIGSKTQSDAQDRAYRGIDKFPPRMKTISSWEEEGINLYLQAKLIVFTDVFLPMIDNFENKKYIQSMSKRNSKEAIKKRTLKGIRHGRHCQFHLHAHLVFVTKYRKVDFTKRILDHLNEVFNSVCEDFEAELIEFEGEGDHVHLLVNYPPKVSLSKLVGSLKGVSSRYVREKNYPEIKKKLWGKSLWSPSYFAGSCGGAPIEVIRQYIEQQERPC